MALGLGYFWWSTEPYITNAVFYVEKDSRKKGVAKHLLKLSGAILDKFTNLEYEIVFNFTGEPDLERKAKFLQRVMNFKLFGMSLIKE